MAKITRATQKLFGSTGPTGDFGVFGSLAAGSPAFTKDIAGIQSLAAWLTGWAAETIANNRPALEDMNATHYVAFYQLAYLLQQGIAEWDSGTTYYTHSYCQIGGQVYISLQDDNLNKSPTSQTAFWKPLAFVAPGTTTMWPFSSAPDGWLILNGASLLKADYPQLDALFAADGYLYGSDATHFTLPDMRGKFPLGKAASGTGSTLGATGGAIDHTHGAGSLQGPNHTHTESGFTSYPDGTGSGHWHYYRSDGNADLRTSPPAGKTLITLSSTAGAVTGDTAAANPPFLALNFIIKT